MSNCAVILCGGQGKRMKTDMPKAMCEVLGVPMLDWVISSTESSGINDICIVTGFCHNVIDEHLNGKYETVVQTERLGTGHAVMQAKDFLSLRPGGHTIVLYGDTPFIDKETITNALDLHIKNDNAVTVITAISENPSGYGRIIRNESGITSIAEHRDCTPSQLMINEINSGVYWFKTDDLLDVIFDIVPDNTQGEYYLTDCIALLLGKGKKADAYISQNPNVVLGANDRRGLLNLNNIARMEIISRHLDNGVNFTCTDGVIIGQNVMIGAGTTIQGGTILQGFTNIGEGCDIGPNTLVSNCTVGNETRLNSIQAYDSVIGNHVRIGPYVHIRPNSVIKDRVKIGDFVEVKNSTIDEATSISHLTYVGDSDVGKNVNLGCGTVTSNYDGANKYRTVIGDGAFVGCNTNLIAPVKIGNNAYTAAGSTVTKDVPDGALAIERGQCVIKEGYSVRKLKGRN